MKHLNFFLLVFLMLGVSPLLEAQRENHAVGSFFRISVVPIEGTTQEDKLKILNEPLFRVVVGEIHKSLANAGFSNLIDYSKLIELNKTRSGITSAVATNSINKIAIENAPTEVLIEVGLEWVDPAEKPNNRQLTLHLKATDPYTASVYLENPIIRSKKRNFPDFETATETLFKIDGKEAISQFYAILEQNLQNSMREGGWLKVKFEVTPESIFKFSNNVRSETTSTAICQILREQSNPKDFFWNESATYLDFYFRLKVPGLEAIDHFKTTMEHSLRELNLPEFESSRIGNWINVIFK